jgi:hypothetical protein
MNCGPSLRGSRPTRSGWKNFTSALPNCAFLTRPAVAATFLVIAYRELRLLELDILRTLDNGTASLDVAQFQILCDVDQFYRH